MKLSTTRPEIIWNQARHMQRKRNENGRENIHYFELRVSINKLLSLKLHIAIIWNLQLICLPNEFAWYDVLWCGWCVLIWSYDEESHLRIYIIYIYIYIYYYINLTWFNLNCNQFDIRLQYVRHIVTLCLYYRVFLSSLRHILHRVEQAEPPTMTSAGATPSSTTAGSSQLLHQFQCYIYRSGEKQLTRAAVTLWIFPVHTEPIQLLLLVYRAFQRCRTPKSNSSQHIPRNCTPAIQQHWNT